MTIVTVNAQFLFFDLMRVHFNWQQEGDFIDHTIDLLSTLTVGKHPILVIMSFLLSVDTVHNYSYK